jgi:hypothetical protein
MGLAEEAGQAVGFDIELGNKIEIRKVCAIILVSEYMVKLCLDLGLADCMDHSIDEIIIRIHHNIGIRSVVGECLLG